MSEHEIASQLHTIFNLLVKRLIEMQDLLQQEHLALIKNENDNITFLAKHKEKLSLQIEQQEALRRVLLEKHQLPFGKTSLEILSRHVSKNAIVELLRTWDKIVNLSQACSTQNQINGVILAHQQRRTQMALRILRGQCEYNEIYSSSGNKQEQFSQNTIARI